MKLQLGERYWRRDGVLSGTIIPNESVDWPFRDAATDISYTERGGQFTSDVDSAYDLVAKAYFSKEEPSQELPPVDTVTMSSEDYAKMQELEKEVEHLKKVIKRKNQIMSDILGIVRDELAKQIGV